MAKEKKFKVGDKIKIAQEKQQGRKNHDGMKGEILKLGATHLYKKNREDPGRELQVITVQLEDENSPRAFPEDQIEKI